MRTQRYNRPTFQHTGTMVPIAIDFRRSDKFWRFEREPNWTPIVKRLFFSSVRIKWAIHINFRWNVPGLIWYWLKLNSKCFIAKNSKAIFKSLYFYNRFIKWILFFRLCERLNFQIETGNILYALNVKYEFVFDIKLQWSFMIRSIQENVSYKKEFRFFLLLITSNVSSFDSHKYEPILNFN